LRNELTTIKIIKLTRITQIVL